MDQTTATTGYSDAYYRDYAGNDALWLATYSRRRPHYAALLRTIQNEISPFTSVAEIGCGAGMFSHALMSICGGGLDLTAGDISDDGVRITRQKLSSFGRAKVVLLDAEAIDLPSSSFDLVASFDVVEHLPNPERFLSEANRILRPGGILLFSTPNPGSIGNRVKVGSGATDPNTWFALRDPTHVNIRSIAAWREACSLRGFEKLRDGSDFLWDVPYFKHGLFLQKVLFKGSAYCLNAVFGIWPWKLGENYYGFWRKPAL